MSYYFVNSYLLLIRAETTLRVRGFGTIYNAVRILPTRLFNRQAQIPYERLCQAMDLACVFYPKTVLCLQRSIATVFLLRHYGWPAELVTGCDIGTFENHAWAELFGQVISDKPYMHEIYQVIDRC